MATHAHSTRTPLLRPSAEAPALLGPGLGRQPGPVTQAIRAMRAADPADLAIASIQAGLASYFADADRQRVRELRRAIADRIEADLALLDALTGDPDLEPYLGEGDDREEENEHGGDVQDEPHDEETDCGNAEDEPYVGERRWLGSLRRSA